MKTLYAVIILMLIPFFVYAERGNWELPSAEMESLDVTIHDAGKYTARFQHRVDSLKRSLNSSRLSESGRTEIMLKISGLYRQNMSDSSLKYAKLAVDISPKADEKHRYLSQLYFVDALGASGIFENAIQQYDSLAAYKDRYGAKEEYFKVGRRLYANIINYVQGQPYIEDKYMNRYVACDDSLLAILPANDKFRTFILAEHMVRNNEPEKAKAVLIRLLLQVEKGDNIYGMTAYQLAMVAKREGDQATHASYLAKAAESDIQVGVREGFALPALAVWLYEQKEFNSAFRYINFALNEAYIGNARARMVSMSRWVPAIDEAYRKNISASRNELMIYGVLTSVLVVALIGASFLLVREIRRSRRAHRALASTSRMKDRYIGNFIGLCSTYSDKYHSLVKMIDRKISSGQASELLAAIKSGKIAEGSDDQFYNEIDSVILTLYPDFVERVNELLIPEERLQLQRGQLTPELRIYAFVRLGVSESTKIAKILNYSVHTVYAYRNRMRKRAIDREHFDENVMQIGLS